MSFASPAVLVALLAVPLVVAVYVVGNRTRMRYAKRFTNPDLLPNVVDRSPGWRRHVPIALLLVGLTVLLVGAARPRALVDVKRENATVVLAIDTSRSMQAIDVRPSRMDAIKLAALKFVKDLPRKYRVGIVDFATQASVAAPATRNRELVQKALEKLTPGGGTALGDGIVTALNVGRAVPREPGRQKGQAGDVPPTTVILFTDGLQEGGEVTAADALKRAIQLHVPINAVLVGSPYGIVRVPRVGGFVQFIRVPADASEVKQIAKLSHGRFYVGPRTADLKPVLSQLKSRIGKTPKKEELSFAFGLGALAFLLAGAALSLIWLRRVP
jgi:Ca-activated chloride channel family protein